MKLYRESFRAMGSPCEIQSWATSQREAKRWFIAARSEIARIEQKYSRYLATSVTTKINRSAGGEGITLDPETCDLLHYADACFQSSEGRFDITSGALRRVWDFKAAAPRLPSQAEIDAVMQHVGWQRATWRAPLLQLPRGMEIDFGGVGKEYAADRAATLCAGQGAHAMLVNLGGDIRVTGAQPNGAAWRIGIVHPRATQPGQTIATMEISSGGVATSGDYERFFELEGRRYCHILDARTGWPVQSLQSVSIAAPACMVAGSLCTLAMLVGESAPQMLRESGFAFIVVDRVGAVRMS
jgi:FAD:protein FMN transferase